MTAKEAKERAERNTPIAKEVKRVMEKIAETCDEGGFSTHYLYEGGFVSQMKVMTALQKKGYYIKEDPKNIHLMYISWEFPL